MAVRPRGKRDLRFEAGFASKECLENNKVKKSSTVRSVVLVLVRNRRLCWIEGGSRRSYQNVSIRA